jgi:hypothetical protein
VGRPSRPLDHARTAAAASAIEFDGVEPFEVLFAPQATAVGVGLRAAIDAQHGSDLLADTAQNVGVTPVVVREYGL